MDLAKLTSEFENCACGRPHEMRIKALEIGRGLVKKTGGILKANGFPNEILLVADENTLKAAEGIIESLKGFKVEYKIFEDLRHTCIEDVRQIESLCSESGGILSVGTGCINDVCRLAAARAGKQLCLFATAPSMDGFASSDSPTVEGRFKRSLKAKQPEIIIADTEILAAAPARLKSAGFGDMIAKYVGLCDWKISALVSGEYYCEKVAALTKKAVDDLVLLAGRVTANDPDTAGKIMESLVLTGLGMSFTKNSRPASGTEHIVAHYIELDKLKTDAPAEFHGDTVGVATLEAVRIYKDIAKHKSIRAFKENLDWEEIYLAYAGMEDEIKELNSPTVTEEVDIGKLEKGWEEIRRIIGEIPPLDELEELMGKAGCPLTPEDVNVSKELMQRALKFHPFMRHRLTLMRLLPMIEFKD